MISLTNTHTLYPSGVKTVSFDFVPLVLHRNRITTDIRVSLLGLKPRLPEAITIPRLKTIHERSENGGSNTSSDVLCLMDSLGFTVTPDIYASLIDECTRKGDDCRALELWDHMKRNKRMIRFLSNPKGLVLINRVLIMLMSCGCVEIAHQLFAKMSRRDTAVWCLMIAGLVDNSLHFEALDLFSQMMFQPLDHQNEEVLRILFACVLKACISDKNMDVGRTLHGWAMKSGYTKNLHVCTTFLEFYSKIGCPEEINALFRDQIQEGNGDAIFWTSALVSNCRENRFQETIHMFRDMGRAGIQKNEFAFSGVLKACGRLRDGGFCGQQAHADAIKHGLVDAHVFVQCSLVDVYSKCGKLADARKVFDTISRQTKNRSTPCWSAMINGYLKNGAYVEAIKTLYQMRSAGVEPRESLLRRVRNACGTRSLEMGIC